MSLLNVGFTGTQELITEAQYNTIWILLFRLDPSCCHHGDCLGADSYFHQLVVARNTNIFIHPPENSIKRAYCNKLYGGHCVIFPEHEYLERNRYIVEESDVLLAAPKSFEEEKRSGTWSTVRYARKLKRPIYIIFPDGSVRHEGPDPTEELTGEVYGNVHSGLARHDAHP